MSETAASTWAMPIVATARMSRGALRKRRTIVSSTMAPTAAAMRRPSGMATPYGSPRVVNSMARTAATLPNSAWAKLKTRFTL